MLRRAFTALFVLPSLVSACDPGSAKTDDGSQSATGGAGSGSAPSATGGAPSATGGSDLGGAPTTGGTSGVPDVPENPTPPERSGFTLLFQDDFESLDTTRWGTGSHTFEENAAQFDPNFVSVEGGFLYLTVAKAETPSAEGKLYRAGELRTFEFFGHGRFETRARFAKGSGIVSSLFTYYDHWADSSLEENWNEIDIEYLGKNPAAVQFNVIHWNQAKVRTAHEKLLTVDFSPADTFHVYAIEWLPTQVNFYIDEQLVHTQTDQVEQFLTLDSRLMMNAWPVVPKLASWAGVVDDTALPTKSSYDWVRVYALNE
jgi:beta-glucanase (GH16 family)